MATVMLIPVAGGGADVQPAETPASGPAGDCGQSFDARQRRVIGTGRLQLAFAPRLAPLTVGRHFSLDIEVCPQGGSALPLGLRVDADMPAHRHGMNYRPTVRSLGAGRYRADGLMLHMPGLWRLRFELDADGRLERLSHDVELQ